VQGATAARAWSRFIAVANPFFATECTFDNIAIFIVHSLDARPSDDGVSLLVEATAFDGNVLRFAIPVDNVKHFIAFLLLWVGTISAGQADDPGAADVSEGSLRIPATSIAIGEPNGNEGYIGISVGRAELIFSMPVSAFGELGQSLLMAGATSPTVPSWVLPLW
jgi:hypothetical protein